MSPAAPRSVPMHLLQHEALLTVLMSLMLQRVMGSSGSFTFISICSFLSLTSPQAADLAPRSRG